MPIRWLAASALIVYSKVKSIGTLENGFGVLFMPNQPSHHRLPDEFPVILTSCHDT